jgi:hypothetical protein
MTKNQEQNQKDTTLKSLESRLRSLPEVEAPETLEAKLVAAIPDAKAGVTQERQLQWHPRAWDFGVTAAATVLIFALMFMVNYGLSVPSQMSLTDLSDTSLVCPRWDQNNFFDDQNSACVEKSLPRELKWPMIKQNESGY